MRVSSADGEYKVNARHRMVLARNGVIFIQAWLNLQLEREASDEIRGWLEQKKIKVERQLKKLDHRLRSEEKPSRRAAKKATERSHLARIH